MKKKLFSTILAAAMMIAALAGCGGGNTASGSGSKGDGNYKFGFTISCRDQFLTSMEVAATKEMEAQGYKLEVNDSDNDVTKQLSHIQTWATQQYSAIIINLVNADNAIECVDAAAGVPCVFVNRLPDQNALSDTVVYVGSDEHDSGRMQSELAMQHPNLKGKTEINAILFQGVLGQTAATLRSASVKQGFEDQGVKVNWVYEDTAEWDRNKAMDKMTQLISSGTKYDVIICNNDEMALGCIEAYKAANKKIDVPILGVDATQVACESIKAGEEFASVYQSSVGQGGGAAKAALQLAKGEKVEGIDENHIVWIPFEPVNADNVQDYLDMYAAK